MAPPPFVAVVVTTSTHTASARRAVESLLAHHPSAPVVAGQGSAYASGLSPSGRLIASAGSKPFYGRPLVAWLPAPGADTYEVEWSPTRYPWRAAKRIPIDGGTATMLPLKPGQWWYRIRGINSALPDGHQAMTWSQPLQVTMAKPKFRLVASSN